MPKLKVIALCFLLPGLAGVLAASMMSIAYLNRLPRIPDPATMRTTPRMISGVTVYQSTAEEQRLDLIGFSSTAMFFIGLGLSMVYLRKEGVAHALEGGDEDGTPGDPEDDLSGCGESGHYGRRLERP